MTEVMRASAENARAVVAEPLKVEVAPAVELQPEKTATTAGGERAAAPQEGQAKEGGERGEGGEEDSTDDVKKAEVAVRFFSLTRIRLMCA